MLIEALAGAFEGVLVLAGCALLWRLAASPQARAARPPAGLPRWEIVASHFLLFLLLVVGGAYFPPIIVRSFLQRGGLEPTAQALVVMVAFELGILAGIALFHFAFAEDSTPATAPGSGSGASGVATFLLSLPLVVVVAMTWHAVLTALHFPIEQQETVDILMKLHSNFERAVFAVLAVIVAPASEELVFRRGLFRYLRGRTPRWVALWVPAVLFGAGHLNWASLAPLVILGVVFSLAYERTGRITTPIVAHALFNLNTVILVLLGVNL